MDYWGGKYVSVCKVFGKLGKSGGMLPWNFGTFITCNLVESGTVFTHNLTIYCAIKAFIKA